MTTRDINELLSLDTYQGMTDDEINLILDYKIDQAVTSREIRAKLESLIMQQEYMMACDRQTVQDTTEMLQYSLNREKTVLPIVQPMRFTPRSLES